MYCQKCGRELPKDASNCTGCGQGVKVWTVPPEGSAGTREVVRATVKDAWQVLRVLSTDPVGGLTPAFAKLASGSAMRVGIAFCLCFALCAVFGFYQIVPKWLQPDGFGGFLRILVVVVVVPAASLSVAFSLARKVFQGDGGLGHDLFVAGTSTLPYGILLLVAGILDIEKGTDLLAILMFFAICLNILMLFVGATGICKMSERAASVAVPVALVASGWLSKEIYTGMLQTFFD